MYRLILSEMILDNEGVRYLREVFFPRRQAFIAIAFQAAKDRGEISQDVDIKFLMDLFYGYSLFRLMTQQIDDNESPTESAPPLHSLRIVVFPSPSAPTAAPRKGARRGAAWA